MYLTLGNIPRGLRRKPSKSACILIGYLPVETELLKATTLSDQKIGSYHQRLFHKAMAHILGPLKEAGTNGIFLTGGNGEVQHVFPVLACYVADFPEQCLVSCTKNGTCPKCMAPSKELADPDLYIARTQKWTREVISEGKKKATIAQFYKHCMEQDVSGSVFKPFWEDFPHTDIHTSITPDILHQLYQGIIKYLIEWCQILMTEAELDARVRALPKTFGIRHFKNGFSVLSQVSGPERKQMAHIFLACIVGKVPTGVIMCVKAILDFVYLAQYKAHDTDTLQYLEDALDTFQKNQKVFIQLEIHPTLNIPKFHALRHYLESIKLFGTTDNYNTEMFERFHIDFAKEGFRASNKRDVFPQMIVWLSRREKVSMFSNYLDLIDNPNMFNPRPKSLQSRNTITIAKHPPYKKRKLATIEKHHNAPNFSRDLSYFLNNFLLHPESDSMATQYALPFGELDVFTQFKFHPNSLQEDDNDTEGTEENNTIKALPGGLNNTAARFDTVVAITSDEAESTGMEGAH